MFYMKKLLITALMLSALLALTACSTGNNIAPQPELPSPPETPAIQGQESTDTQSNEQMDTAQAWIIEELGATIVTAGTFWEEWWGLRGRFAHEHIAFDEWDDVPSHMMGVYSRILPTSGFDSINSVHSYLLQYYTESWIAREQSGELAAFVEYNGVLYIHTARAGFPSPRWETAAHVLIEQDGSRVVVETTVPVADWDAYTVEPWDMVRRFTFVDGRIDDGPWGVDGVE